MDDLVSVIVPFYNAEKYLDRCIHSILEQSYKNIELILVNDGSTDSSRNICERFKNESVFIINQQNAGAAAARNNGIKSANGKFIVFVDADDWLDCNHIESLINAHDQDGQIVICGYKEIYENSVVNKKPSNRKYYYNQFYKIIDKWGVDPVVGSPCNKLFEKDIINSNNISYPVGRMYAEDFSFILEVFKYTETIKTIGSCTYNYNRLTENSLSKINFINLKRWWEEEKTVYEQMKECKYLKNNENVINRIFGYMIGSNFVFQIRRNAIDADFLKEIDCNYRIVVKNTCRVNSTWKMNIVYYVERMYFLTRNATLKSGLEILLNIICKK
ncbi:MAG: glycosyltransferase [Pseudobutyrivibrio ruminis]|uniref:glycosyltransferase family 2 protein n=1 Tax=Pseudobutyrivibrio ruminis TaxID=46206 RepID=UPI0026EE3DD7|nr:glycosyltransferase family 2 protein [Pseudobutyrivibrio ruminis]MBE5912923.1 glycosyltransferase [Pseudobutyrivibrio ruminis]